MLSIVAAAFILLSPQSNQAQGAAPGKITLEARALPVAEVLAQASKQCGFQLTSAKALEDDFVIVTVKDVTREDFMAKLAQALSADWEAEGSGMRIGRSSTLIAQLKKDDDAYRLGSIVGAQAAAVEKLSKMGPFDDGAANKLAIEVDTLLRSQKQNGEDYEWDPDFYERQDGLSQRMPVARLTLKLATLLDPKVLASLPCDTRTVFATDPTPMQLALPKAAFAAVDGFVQQQNVWSKATKILDAGLLQKTLEQFGFESLRRRDPIEKTPSKIFVAIVVDRNCNISVEVNVADSKGDTIGTGNDWLSDDREPEAPKAAQPKPEKIDVALSADAKSLLECTKFRYWEDPSAKAPQPNQALRNILLNPEKLDSASLLKSEVAFAYAEKEGINFISAVPENAGFEMRSRGDGSFYPDSEFGLKDSRWQDVKGSRSEGWLVVAVRRPYKELQWRLSRHALGTFLRDAVSKNVVSMDALSTLATFEPRDQWESPWREMLKMLAPDIMPEYNMPDWEFLRLYGMLSPPQKSVLLNGGSVPLASLQPSARAQALRIVYGGYPRLTDENPMEEAQSEEEMESRMFNLVLEPTIRLPRGIPSGASISLSVERSQGIQMLAGGYSMSMFSIESYAQMSANPQFGRQWFLTDEAGEVKYQYIDRDEWNFRLNLEPMLSVQGQAQVLNRADTPVTDPSKFKPDVLRMIKEATDRAKSQNQIPPVNKGR